MWGMGLWTYFPSRGIFTNKKVGWSSRSNQPYGQGSVPKTRIFFGTFRPWWSGGVNTWILRPRWFATPIYESWIMSNHDHPVLVGSNKPHPFQGYGHLVAALQRHDPNAKYGFRRQGELRDAPATSSNPRWKCNIHENPLKWQNVAKKIVKSS